MLRRQVSTVNVNDFVVVVSIGKTVHDFKFNIDLLVLRYT